MTHMNAASIVALKPFVAVAICALSMGTPAQAENPLKKRPPNILICIADDASQPHFGAYGADWIKTPGFDRVAREGLLFNRAYTPNAKCAPSRSCILTGRNSWQLGAAANHWAHFPAEFKTYAETLKEHGYLTGYTAKGWAPGNPGTVNGKPRQLLGPTYNKRKLTPPTTGISSIDYAGNFDDFLDARTDDTPFCFWYGGLEPHRRYEYGSGAALGGKKTSEVGKVYSFWPDNQTVRNDLLDYAFEIEYFDQHLQRMLESLEQRGELDNTIVIVTADNGMPFPRIKGQAYEYSNHLPLAIMWKDGIIQPGRRVNDFVSFIDFAPTILEVTGLSEKQSGMQPITGHSLVDIFSAKPQHTRDHVLIGKERHDVGRPHDVGYPIRGIVKGNYLYIENFAPDRWPAGNPETGYLNCDGSPTKTLCLDARTHSDQNHFWQWSFGKRPEAEMYNIKKDPECLNNLTQRRRFSKRKKALRKQLVEELREEGDPRMSGRGHIFDDYEYAHPASVGFYERFMAGEKMRAGWVNESDFEAKPLD